MARRAVFTIGLLAVANGLLMCAPSRAQTPAVPQGCPSPSVPSEKLRANAGEKVEASRKVVVERIEFDQPFHLSDSDVEQVIKTANENEWDADSPTWVDGLAEIGLRSAWQDQGYFQVVIDSPHAQSIGGDSEHERFLVTVHVINEGPQFHLGNIQFTGGTGIPEVELRRVFPLREGEIFSVKQVRLGIEGLTKLYSSLGYLDFTAIPNTEVDDNLQRISLVMRLDEQTQYRIGSVEIRGLDPSVEARLRSILVPGEVFNPQSLEAFFKENRAVLPSRGVDNFEIRRNAKAGIIDLTFDPQFCRDSE
jgi:outer membrane protein assembly factor BamA